MITGRPMFPGDSEIDELFKIFQVSGAAWQIPNPRTAHLVHGQRLQLQAARLTLCPTSFVLGSLLAVQLLGTPTDDTWKDVSLLPDWQAHFPSWKRQDLAHDYSALGIPGVDLLAHLLSYEPRLRIVGKDALVHEYFDTFDAKSVGKGGI